MSPSLTNAFYHRFALAPLTIAAYLGFAFIVPLSPAHAQQPATTATQVADNQDTSTDFLSDEGWRALSYEQRRERSSKAMIARYVPDGSAPKLEDLDRYVERFADATVYDPRYYLYKVHATPVPGTTGSVVLSGEVYPHHYREGLQEALEMLRFNVQENNIVSLPRLASGQKPYGVSTTSAATLRREPRARAEQLNSVARGGWIRVLRTATASDAASGPNSSSHHAPGTDLIQNDSPDSWILAQTMEGYLGFARKADFEMQDDYQLPDGILKFPLPAADNDKRLPAGVFVYGDPSAGWHLFSGEKIPSSAQVADMRPQFTAEKIETLMKPFMSTHYVWGGVTDEGIDCSGFSQFFMRTAGVMLPRDAVQQATTGFIVAWGKDVIKKAIPGDLIFFATDNGRINHVAISLGNGRVIHSAGKGVHLSRLDEPKDQGDDNTMGDSIMFARRVAVR